MLTAVSCEHGWLGKPRRNSDSKSESQSLDRGTSLTEHLHMNGILIRNKA